MDTKTRVFQILEPAKTGDTTSRAFDLSLITLIALNVIALILESVDWIYALAPNTFHTFEMISLLVFTTEYAARIWSCTASTEFAEAFRGRLRFAMKPLVVFDFLAILPLFLPFLGVDLRFLRVIRLLRAFRLAKVARYSVALQTLGRVVLSKKEELVVAFSVIALLLILFSSFVYVAENRAQPDHFVDIPTAMWWCLGKITRLNLVELTPLTLPGKALTAMISILGVALIALPTGILSAGLMEELRKSGLQLCPHCGREV